MKKKRKIRGFTLVELLVVVLIIAMLIAILLPSLAKAREAARRMECATRMRQVGLGVFQYEKDFVCMPNAQWNAFRQVGEYLGATGGTVSGPGDAKATDVFRCPSDEYLAQDAYWNALSYAPVVDSGYIDGDDDGTPDSNFTNCAWSYVRTGYGATGANAKVWQLRNLTQVAPDTAILLEYWDASNRLNLDQETPAGYLLYDYSGDGGNDGDKNAQGTINFNGDPCLIEVGAVPDVGGYTFLSIYGYEATQRNATYGIGTILHDGVINLLYVDGSVLSRFLKEVTRTSPMDEPIWTRTAD